MKRTAALVAKRFLVIEDEPAISEICQRVIAGEGFQVDTAVSGKTVKAMLRKNDYALLLIDIKTPGMSGKDLYEYLEEKHPEMVNRVILTTGALICEETKSFLEESNRPFLPKPFTPEELKAIIRDTLKEGGNDTA